MTSQKRFEHHVDRFNRIVAGATKVVGVSLAALVVLSFSSLQPLMNKAYEREQEIDALLQEKSRELLKLRLAMVRQREAEDRRDDFRRAYALEKVMSQRRRAPERSGGKASPIGTAAKVAVDLVDIMKDKSPAPDAEARPIPSSVPLAKKKAESARKEVDKFIQKVKSASQKVNGVGRNLEAVKKDLANLVPLEFFGLRMQVPGLATPGALSLFTLILGIYIFVNRRLAHRELCSAVFVARQRLRLSSSDLKGLVLTPPIWLLPFPSKLDPAIPRSDVLNALGWSESERKWWWAGILVLLAINVTQGYATICGIQMALIMFEGWMVWLTVVGLALCFAATLYFLWTPRFDKRTFTYWTVPPPPAPRGATMTRRAILGAGFTAVAGVVTLLTINRGSVFSRLQERLKTQRSKPNSKPGYLIMQAPARFVKRDGSNTVHYIDKLGRLLGVRSLDSVVWSDADIASLPKPLVARTIKVFDHNPKDRLAHINWSIFGRAIEEQALEALLNDNAPAAMRLLWLGVFHDLARPADTRQLRLYDLLAVLSFRNDRASLHRLLEFCERALADPLFRMRNRDLESRVTMWKSKTWQKKWNEDRVRRWHGVVV